MGTEKLLEGYLPTGMKMKSNAPTSLYKQQKDSSGTASDRPSASPSSKTSPSPSPNRLYPASKSSPSSSTPSRLFFTSTTQDRTPQQKKVQFLFDDAHRPSNLDQFVKKQTNDKEKERALALELAEDEDDEEEGEVDEVR